MLAGKREFCFPVVKLRALPLRRGVASDAVLGESRSRVLRTGRFLKVRHVAGCAVAGNTGKLISGVTLYAGYGNVLSRQSKPGGGAVIESGAGPLRRVVTGFASGGEARGRVVRICRLLEVRQVASGAGGAQSGVLAAHMAGGARGGGMFAGQWEARCAVVEGGAGPLRRGMAGFARRREARRSVVRVRGLLEFGQVASGAGGAQSGELSAHMASGAGGGGVLAGQRETCGVVIERRAGPLRRVVARLARGGEAAGCVIRIRRLLEFGQMAGGAGGAQAGELAVHVAGGAGGRCMFAGQREAGGVVIERCAGPLRRCMAGFAGCGEVRRRMVWTGCLLEIGQMASGAGRAQSGELAVDVAGGAGGGGMFAGQREARGAVIERGGLPLCRCMARFTGGGKARGRVVRIGRLLEVRQVTGGARGGEAGIPAAGMALRAGRCGVLPCEREFVLAVIELRAGPLAGGVAYAAIGGESRGDMRRSGGLLKSAAVTIHARAGCSGKAAVEVALGAGDGGVFSGESEPGQRVVEFGALPDFRGVASLAIGGKIRTPVVRIGGLLEVGGVAADASLRSAGEAAAHVTGGAGGFGMRAGEGEFCQRRVVEPGAQPRHRTMAGAAFFREARGYVIGICGPGEVGRMATEAIGRRGQKPASHVARRARNGAVRASQCEAGESIVIEAGGVPVIYVVAGFTSGGEPGRLVIHNASLPILRQVATDALRAQASVHSGGRAAMTGIAFHGCMGAQ